MKVTTVCITLCLLSGAGSSFAADSVEQREFRLAVEKQRATYLALPAEWRVAERNQLVVQRTYARASAAVSTCRRKIWSSLFKDVFSSLEGKRSELDQSLKDAEKVRRNAQNVLSVQDVARKRVEAKYAGKERGFDYWSDFSEVTSTVMTEYYQPMKEVLFAYGEYQKGFTTLSRDMTRAANECNSGNPKKAVEKLIAGIDIFGKISKLIVSRLLPFLA
ncbi:MULTISPECIES: hypothetical protein [Rhizobium]|uniref:hypothetical protein n=1 Tax=Rhizobium TaxID=379 RepID=UPI00103AC238|nr:hypothetical protein [Rhizobium leguminosarum]TBZ99696.1 hypothetical protein E0H57_27980 [Rhizobium leguminosarum bv. viciae]UFW76288.1 hypothetical protein RlegSU303_13460 [Rhizobium leguminosarum bv. viciae]